MSTPNELADRLSAIARILDDSGGAGCSCQRDSRDEKAERIDMPEESNILSREERIANAKRFAPQNDVQIREGLAIGELVTINADMLSMLTDDWKAAVADATALRESLAAKELELKEAHESHDEEARQFSDSLNQAWRERDEWKARAERFQVALGRIVDSGESGCYAHTGDHDSECNVGIACLAIAAEKEKTDA